MKSMKKILLAACICWTVLFVLFFTTMFVLADWGGAPNDVQFILGLLAGPGGVLLGMLGGGILLGVFYQAKPLRPGFKERGMVAAVGVSLCVATANFVWGFFHSIPYFDVALGLGFSAAGLLWLWHGIQRNWGRVDSENNGAQRDGSNAGKG